MRAIVVAIMTAISALLLTAAPAQAAPPTYATYTTGDEWGLWTKPHTVTLSCDRGDRIIGFRFTHGQEFAKKTKVVGRELRLTLRGGDPEKYDSAVGAVVICQDRR